MNNTLQNGFMVLEYLAECAEDCSVKEIAEHFGLPNSHACRLLKTLADTGYVRQTPGSRKYHISLKILMLSHARLGKIAMRIAGRPYLQQMIRDLNRPVFLSCCHQGFSLVVDVIYPDFFEGDAGLCIGAVHSINRSACGKVCTAFGVDESDLDAFLEHGDWKAYTAHSITDKAVFKRELEGIRRRGFASMYSERSVGLGALGAPVFGGGNDFLGALGVILPSGEDSWTPQTLERFTNSICAGARSISFALGKSIR